MFRTLFVVSALLLSACGMPPGLHTMPSAQGKAVSDIAVVKGVQNYRSGSGEGELVRLLSVDGEPLPYQKGGPGSHSVALLPGPYVIEVFWLLPVHDADMSGVVTMPLNLQAGCAYQFAAAKPESLAYHARVTYSVSALPGSGQTGCARN